MKNNLFVRLFLEILAGVIISTVLAALLIFVGYYKVNSGELDSYDVNFIGVTLYKITKVSGEYAGNTVNQGMSIIGAVCCILTVVVNEVRILVKSKKVRR